MGKQEVKGSRPGAPQGLGEELKLLKCILVLLSKENIDRSSFGAKSLVHLVLI
jgi:hypothetical protein